MNERPQMEATNVNADADVQRLVAAIEVCQKVLRSMTGIILLSFVLIIVLTTVSTSGFVQFTAKTLYYLILASAVTSLIAWAVRVRMQKKIGQTVNVAAEVLKKL